MRIFDYKVVGDCTIRADVHEVSDVGVHPVIVFIHGGCLMMGNRGGHLTPIKLLTDAGYNVVSIDYRLAPETKLEHIIEDLRDAFRWVREEGGNLFHIDPNRIGVMGESAGGYLTLMSGFVADPPPKALVSLYGYSDIDGPWYSKPDPFYRRQPLVQESSARNSVGSRTISESISPHNRRLFYLYCRQNGLWPKEVVGLDPESSPRSFDPFCPIRNITPRYPPTILLHGDQDTDVPYEQSVNMAKGLEKAGVSHRLVTILGRGHSFDDAGLSDPVVADAFQQVLAFLKLYV
ncbi:MAG: alpha/beta hydrolase [Thaumarchaeota archaeon]|nr:alpha/beta hydrolase [Nitrososphaerota archaeon]